MLIVAVPVAGVHFDRALLSPAVALACVLLRKSPPQDAAAGTTTNGLLQTVMPTVTKAKAGAIGAAAAAAPAAKAVIVPVVDSTKHLAARSAEVATNLAHTAVEALAEPTATVRDAAEALASASAARLTVYASASAAATSAAAGAAAAAYASAKLSVASALLVARAKASTAQVALGAFAATVTPVDAAAAGLLAVSALALRRAKTLLRTERQGLLEKLAEAEGALNATRPAITKLENHLKRANLALASKHADTVLTKHQMGLLEMEVDHLEEMVHVHRSSLSAKRNETAMSLDQVRAMHAADLAALSEGYEAEAKEKAMEHSAQVTEIKTIAAKKRAILAGLLSARRTALKEATLETQRLKHALAVAEDKHGKLASAADAARFTANQAEHALQEAEGRVEVSNNDLAAHQRKHEAETQRADEAEAKLAALQREVDERDGRFVEGSTFNSAAQASLAALQLELTSAREQVQTLRAAQRKSAMDTARKTSEAAVELGAMQQKMAAAEAAHASEAARAEALWAQREAEFRADLQTANSRRQQEIASITLQKAETEAANAELEARLHAAESSERSTEAALQQARLDAKSARNAAEQHAARTAALEESLGEARVEAAKYKHDLHHNHAERDQSILKAQMITKKTQEALEEERGLRRQDAVNAKSEMERLEQVAEEAHAQIIKAKADAKALSARAASNQAELEAALAAANEFGATLQMELAKAQGDSEAAGAAAKAAALEAAALRAAKDRLERSKEREMRSEARLDAATVDIAAAAAAAPDVHLPPKQREWAPGTGFSTVGSKEPENAVSVDPATGRTPKAPRRPFAAAIVKNSAHTRMPKLPRPFAKNAPDKAAAVAATPAAKPKKRPLTMIVKSLAQHISPSRMLVEFPTAITAEAHFDTRTNERTALVLTFDAAHPPASRESTHFGCKLQPVVTPPEGAESTRRVVWYRKDGTVRQHTRAAADATVGI